MDAKLVKLSDGRNLAYAEYGKSDGIPVFFLHGSPGSRIAFDDAIANANEFGLWMINPERPGYGFSDFKPYETILEWTNDLGELADNLHLERFGVLGVSAGDDRIVARCRRLRRMDDLERVEARLFEAIRSHIPRTGAPVDGDFASGVVEQRP